MQGLARNMIVQHESNMDNKKGRMREIDGSNDPGDVDGAFTLGCCGSRKPKDEAGGCC